MLLIQVRWRVCWWSECWYTDTLEKNQAFSLCMKHEQGHLKFFSNVSVKTNCTAPATAKSLQSCLTLCDPTDGSPPGSFVPGILQARTLEWVAISFSNAWKWKVKVKSLSRVRLLATPWTAAHQAPPSMGFSKQEYWSGVPLPSPIFLQRYPHLGPESSHWIINVLVACLH